MRQTTYRLHGIAPVLLTLAMFLPGCNTTTSPDVGFLEISITGDFSTFERGEILFDGLAYPVTLMTDRLDAMIGQVSVGIVEFDLLLYASDVTTGQQTTTRYTHATARTTFEGGVVRLDEIDLQERLNWIQLANPVAVAVLRDDPCVLETRVTTASPVVDMDRALYAGSFVELIAFVFVRTGTYMGENLFDLVEDYGNFLTVCEDGAFELADTLICVDVSTYLECLYHAWNLPGQDPIPGRDLDG